MAKYKELLLPVNKLAKRGYLKIGFAFAFSQFATYFVMAAMFYAGGVLMKNDPSLNPEDVFIALFVIIFGASQAGSASAFGPDMGKATGAADRIFAIIEHISPINAV